MYHRNRSWEFYVTPAEMDSIRSDWQQARVHYKEVGRRDVTTMNPRDHITFVNRDNIFDRIGVCADDVVHGEPYVAALAAAERIDPKHMVPKPVVDEVEHKRRCLEDFLNAHFNGETEHREFDVFALVEYIRSSDEYRPGKPVVIASLRKDAA